MLITKGFGINLSTTDDIIVWDGTGPLDKQGWVYSGIGVETIEAAYSGTYGLYVANFDNKLLTFEAQEEVSLETYESLIFYIKIITSTIYDDLYIYIIDVNGSSYVVKLSDYVSVVYTTGWLKIVLDIDFFKLNTFMVNKLIFRGKGAMAFYLDYIRFSTKEVVYKDISIDNPSIFI